ncbi:OLC1v1036246C1 [Oldenlandia corymbosa var. corymbosa]|uniref:1-phosphatidylinositol 4-kinase n=1 Tax=Oldenlandia corymbosa var. corymbosa TaxID=529605 RepID=A0AAV1CW34_OLDCO|nr:OLC1v1036246C1 [Oldenlandia corymbosa var. corymbosa]
MAVAIDQHHAFKPFGRPPRCKRPSYSQFDYTMLESTYTTTRKSIKNAIDFNPFHKSFSTPCLSISTTFDEELESSSRIEIIAGNGAPKVRALVVEVTIAMASGVTPEPVSSGLGGAYFMRCRNGETIAVAKPIDEEPLAFNNPKGFAGRMLGQPGMKKSIRIGETGFRELAAYLLDHDGFAGVPPTALVKMSYNKFNVNTSDTISPPTYKIASLQRFVEHQSDAADLGPSGFSVSAIHRIGILDLRLFNLDRHAGNILVKKGQEAYCNGIADLVPIDHGFCLPESLEDPYFEWLHWPQALIPFSESEIEYISSLDPFKDAELLRVEVPCIRESSVRILILCTIFLKNATDSGMCLADIGEMMTREFNGGEENWSAFESLCMNAKTNIGSILNNDFTDEQGEEDINVLQFDDNEDSYTDTNKSFLESYSISGKVAKIPRFASESLLTTVTESKLSPREEGGNYRNRDADTNSNTAGEECTGQNVVPANSYENCKLGGVLLRSISFTVPNLCSDHEEICFGDMSNEVWDLYLDIFQKLLPEFLEERKCMCLSTQRLGTSCEF